MQANLEQLILYENTIKLDSIVKYQAGIWLKTARKWLNYLGYKWKNVQKGGFFYELEQKNRIKYWKTFLKKIMSLLPYLVKFKKDSTIIPKEYPNNCTVGGPNQQPVIMIIYDKNTFSVHDSWQNIWTLEGHKTLCLKSKKKDIMILDFLLL